MHHHGIFYSSPPNIFLLPAEMDKINRRMHLHRVSPYSKSPGHIFPFHNSRANTRGGNDWAHNLSTIRFSTSTTNIFYQLPINFCTGLEKMECDHAPGLLSLFHCKLHRLRKTNPVRKH